MLDIQPMLGVIALPVLAPLAAILQLLFPGLMRDQWQRYQVAISVLMSQSTVLVLQWVLVTAFGVLYAAVWTHALFRRKSG